MQSQCCYLTVSHPDKPIRFTLISSFTCHARNVQFYWLFISLLAQLWLNGLDSLRQTGWLFTTQKISLTESTHVDKNWYIIHNAGPIHDIKSMCMYTMCQCHILLHVYPLIIIIMISRLIVNHEAMTLWRHWYTIKIKPDSCLTSFKGCVNINIFVQNSFIVNFLLG